MDLNTVAVIGFVLIALTNLIWLIVFITFGENIRNEISNTNRGLRRMAEAVGFEYEKRWHNDEIYIVTPWDTGKLPATRHDVETFFKDHNERLTAVYQHFGIKVGHKVTPAVPEKREIVVEKVVKK